MFVNIEVSDIADSIFYLIEISIFRYIGYLFRYFGVEIFCIMQRILSNLSNSIWPSSVMLLFNLTFANTGRLSHCLIQE